jgi:hypothetical protein
MIDLRANVARQWDGMNALPFIHRKARAGAKPRPMLRQAIEQAQVMGMVAGLVGGGAAGMFGSVFTAASWLIPNKAARQWLSITGATLLFLTIPLLIIGGFCMDWLEKDNPRRDRKTPRYDDEEEEQ